MSVCYRIFLFDYSHSGKVLYQLEKHEAGEVLKGM